MRCDWNQAGPPALASQAPCPRSAWCDFRIQREKSLKQKKNLHELMDACIYRCCDKQPFSEPKL